MKKALTNIGTYDITLKASRQTIKRTIYKTECGKFYIKYYGNLIEVIEDRFNYITVENY